MTITKEQNKDNQFEVFSGESLHPSLDIKNGILTLGFRFRSKPQEEKEIFIIVNENNIQILEQSNFNIGGKTYYFEKKNRKLMRIEERWGFAELKEFINDHSNLKFKENRHANYLKKSLI